MSAVLRCEREIIEALKYARENCGVGNNGLSIGEAAKALDLSDRQLKKLEEGKYKKDTPAGLVIALSRLYGVTPDYFAMKDMEFPSELDRALFYVNNVFDSILRSEAENRISELVNGMVDRLRKDGFFVKTPE